LTSDIETQAKNVRSRLPCGITRNRLPPPKLMPSSDHPMDSWRYKNREGASYSCVLPDNDSASVRDRSRVIGSALINQGHTLRLASYSKSPTSLYSGASAAIKVLFCRAEKWIRFRLPEFVGSARVPGPTSERPCWRDVEQHTRGAYAPAALILWDRLIIF
jgi:hypothetical protein